jgi:hypothetical protein
MKIVIGTTDNPLSPRSKCWCIFLVDDDMATRMFGPDTLVGVPGSASNGAGGARFVNPLLP